MQRSTCSCDCRWYSRHLLTQKHYQYRARCWWMTHRSSRRGLSSRPPRTCASRARPADSPRGAHASDHNFLWFESAGFAVCPHLVVLAAHDGALRAICLGKRSAVDQLRSCSGVQRGLGTTSAHHQSHCTSIAGRASSSTRRSSTLAWT